MVDVLVDTHRLGYALIMQRSNVRKHFYIIMSNDIFWMFSIFPFLSRSISNPITCPFRICQFKVDELILLKNFKFLIGARLKTLEVCHILLDFDLIFFFIFFNMKKYVFIQYCDCICTTKYILIIIISVKRTTDNGTKKKN